MNEQSKIVSHVKDKSKWKR